MTHKEIESLQHELNRFVKERLYNVSALRVDGELGFATKRRIRAVKFYLGYKHPLHSDVDHRFRMRLRYPRRLRYTNPLMMRRGNRRRVRQREEAKENERKAQAKTGVQSFDGRPCAAWMVPYLKWARAHGWNGSLNSGFRDPVYSEQLCYRRCGRPSCPGTCAGRSSNHSGNRKPRGAVDVSWYVQFGQLMHRCPYSPKLINRLGARDPVHYSASGN